MRKYGNCHLYGNPQVKLRMSSSPDHTNLSMTLENAAKAHVHCERLAEKPGTSNDNFLNFATTEKERESYQQSIINAYIPLTINSKV